MAIYPTTLKIGAESAMEQLDDLVLDRAVNGAARVRAYYTGRKRTFTVVHPAVALADRDSLLSFYDTNRLLPVSLVWIDGTTYTCVFVKAPLTVPVVGGVWNLESRLAEV